MRRRKAHNLLLHSQYTAEELEALFFAQEVKTDGKAKRKPRAPMRDNSRNIAVHMTDAQYGRLRTYMTATRLPVSTYFRKLIACERLRENAFELTRDLHAAVNKIYSNVRQITRNPRALKLDADAVRRLEYMADQLCKQVYLLSNQE